MSNIPQELHDFFNTAKGQILLIKGASGTGKSTFALEMVSEFAEPKQKSVYIFTRLEEEQITNNFPIISELWKDKKILVFDRFEPIADGNRFGKELDVLVNDVDISLFVIDTIDAISERFDHPNRKLKEILEIIKKQKLNTILVQEEGKETYLDYLADGIVTLIRDEYEGQRVRFISLDKLRGVEIMQTKYLVSLKDGRFQSFSPFDPGDVKPRKWKSLPDNEVYFSTGIKDLDTLLGGGYRKGSYNVIEIADNVTSEEYLTIIRPIILNFLALNRGVIAVLTGGDHPETFRNDFTRFIDKKDFDVYMRIADYFSPDSDHPYIIPLGVGRDEAIKRWSETVIELRDKENKPILDFTGFDTLEYTRGESLAIRELLNGVSSTKVSKDLGLGIIKPGLKLTQGIKNMADTYLKILDITRCCCIYGLKPQTPLYVITPDQKLKFPSMRLTPLV
ncbi:ATPase domain-containing protein [[Eubacterium] cellulosolvens]